MISYNMGTASLRPEDTVATYTCNTGYTLNGGSIRTCGSDEMWSGLASTCRGEFCNFYTVCVCDRIYVNIVRIISVVISTQ